jgi:hypothetical protein
MLSLPVLFGAATLSCGREATPADAQTDPVADSTFLVTAALFHSALERGDSAAAANLLASDLTVLEGGDVENRGQYLASHLSADIEFAKAVREERRVVDYSRQGNTSWIISRSIVTGIFRGKIINSTGAELMILGRTPGGWKIRAVHWSSARRQKSGT